MPFEAYNLIKVLPATQQNNLNSFEGLQNL